MWTRIKHLVKEFLPFIKGSLFSLLKARYIFYGNELIHLYLIYTGNQAPCIHLILDLKTFDCIYRVGVPEHL